MKTNSHATYALVSREEGYEQDIDAEKRTNVNIKEDYRHDTTIYAYNEEESPKITCNRGLKICTIILSIFLILLGVTTILGLRFGKGGDTVTKGDDKNKDASPKSQPKPKLVQNDSSPSSSSSSSSSRNQSAIPVFKPKIIKVLPHDPKAFTQGFEYHDGYFWESTGLNFHSSLRKQEIKSGKILMKKNIDGKYFGEGLTYLKTSGRIIMLTWKSGKGFLFNATNFKEIDTFTYTGEGWGLTTNYKTNPPTIYMSDGTPTVRVLTPDNLSTPKSTFQIKMNGKKVKNLNEIEYICDEIWGNIWTTNCIVRIDPNTGNVKSQIDVSGILPRLQDKTKDMDVLNGIAFDPNTGRLWLTGKKWLKIYQVEIDDPTLDLKSC